MTKLAELHPIAENLAPFQPGEVVAFREDHSTHGATLHEDGGITAPGKYGLVKEVGLDKDGQFAFNVITFDSASGPPETAAEDAPDYQAYMEEIQ